MEASLSATPSPAHLDPLEEFNLRLEDIIRTFDPTHRDLQVTPHEVNLSPPGLLDPSLTLLTMMFLDWESGGNRGRM